VPAKRSSTSILHPSEGNTGEQILGREGERPGSVADVQSGVGEVATVDAVPDDTHGEEIQALQQIRVARRGTAALSEREKRRVLRGEALGREATKPEERLEEMRAEARVDTASASPGLRSGSAQVGEVQQITDVPLTLPPLSGMALRRAIRSHFRRRKGKEVEGTTAVSTSTASADVHTSSDPFDDSFVVPSPAQDETPKDVPGFEDLCFYQHQTSDTAGTVLRVDADADPGADSAGFTFDVDREAVIEAGTTAESDANTVSKLSYTPRATAIASSSLASARRTGTQQHQPRNRFPVIPQMPSSDSVPATIRGDQSLAAPEAQAPKTGDEEWWQLQEQQLQTHEGVVSSYQRPAPPPPPPPARRQALFQTGLEPPGSANKRSATSEPDAFKPSTSVTPDALGVDDSDHDGRRKKAKKASHQGSIGNRQTTVRRSMKFACPYYKRNPRKYCKWTSCPGPGWDEIHRVKTHLYRRHMLPLQCPRCWETCATDAALQSHLQKDPPCAKTENLTLVEGITKEQEKRLRSRKKIGGKGSEPATDEDKWREIYMILFPDDDREGIPCACKFLLTPLSPFIMVRD